VVPQPGRANVKVPLAMAVSRKRADRCAVHNAVLQACAYVRFIDRMDKPAEMTAMDDVSRAAS
jgi:hypothetical protein